MGKLTALQVKSFRKPGRYPDGDGLFLLVGVTGTKSWMLRIQVDGRRRDLGLGSLNGRSLAQARDAAIDLRRQCREQGFAHSNLPPRSYAAALRAQPARAYAAATQVRAPARPARPSVPTFREVAVAVHAERLQSWRNGKHQVQWLASLEIDVFPFIGNTPVDAVDGPAVREVLAKIWLAKPETARRVRQRVGAILDWSSAKGYRATEFPMRSLSMTLPRQPKKKGHFEAMPYPDVPAFLAAVRERRRSMGRFALETLIQTAARSGEIRGARWSEIDLKAATWTVPAERMKAGVKHVAEARSELFPQRSERPFARHLRGCRRLLSLPHYGTRGRVFRAEAGPFAQRYDRSKGQDTRQVDAAHRSVRRQSAPARQRRLEALRRTAGVVDRDVTGEWRIAPDHRDRAARYEAQRGVERPVTIETLSTLPLQQQATIDAPTWLDRELTRDVEHDKATTGFGRDVRRAMAQRQQWLIEEGLMQREDGGTVSYRRDLVDQLRRRDVARAAGQLSQELGLQFAETEPGRLIEGTYKRPIDLASGRYALIERSHEFSLVPWRPVLEKQLDRYVSGHATGDSISWTFGRQRGGQQSSADCWPHPAAGVLWRTPARTGSITAAIAYPL